MNKSQDQFFTQLKSQRGMFNRDMKRPFFCDILVSERCNLHCRKCYFWKYGIENEVDIEDYKKFIVSLKELVKAPFEINFGGGEPLLKKGILELIALCAQQGFHPAVSTNATLIDEEMAKKLSVSGLHRLSISLDSLCEDTHDYMTGTAGSYQRLMEGIRHLKKHWLGGDINLHTVITDINLNDIRELVEWVNRDSFFTGIAFQALAQPFRTNGRDQWYLDPEYNQLWPKDAQQISKIMDMLIDFKRSGYKVINPIPQLAVYKKYYTEPESFSRASACNFGDYIFNVNVLGLVHLCCFMPPIGSIKNNTIKDIWCSERARQTRESMYNCQKNCNNIVNCYFQDDTPFEEKSVEHDN